jgi:S1-C subfamily serine protease
MTKTNPDHNVYLRAMGSRVGALQVIIRRRSGEVVSWGSAFVINDSCHVPLALTCNHVVRGKSHRVGDMVFVRKMMPAGVQELNASVVETNPLHDIALLSIPGIRPHTPLPISLTLATVYNVGDCGIAVGYCNPDRLFTEPVCSRLPTVSPGCIRYACLSP